MKTINQINLKPIYIAENISYLFDTCLPRIQADSCKHIHQPGQYTILRLNKDCWNIRWYLW